MKLFLLLIVVFTLNAMGRIQDTNNPFDILLIGNSNFYKLEDTDGSFQYTREHSFVIHKDGFVVNADGAKLAPGFQLPENAASVEVSRDGLVQIYLKDIPTPISLGHIEVYRKTSDQSFADITHLKSEFDIHQGRIYIKD